jgi:hypothetical protein
MKIHRSKRVWTNVEQESWSPLGRLYGLQCLLTAVTVVDNIKGVTFFASDDLVCGNSKLASRHKSSV